jgi:hypothetical protein
MEIKKAIRLIGPLLVEGVLSVRNHSHNRLVEMLHELQFITRSVAVTTDSVIIQLQILDADLLYLLLAGEANKFLLASRVSYERSTQEQPKNASWQAIENYYSAYYGVHYLLRLTGISVSNIDNRGTKVIERSAYGTHPSVTVPGGLYIIRYDSSSEILTLTKNLKKPGGSHQQAWQLWEELVEKLSAQASADLIEYARISIDLAEHKRFLTRSTSKYNPPEIRGEINYQFIGGAWIFEKNAKKSVEILQRSIADTKLTMTSDASTPEGLILNNKIIIGLAKAVFMHASDKYPRGVCRSLSNKYKAYVS